MLLGIWHRSHRGMCLARRARPDKVVACERKRERVGLDEAEGIARLRLEIDAGYFEAGAVEAHGGPASAAEEIQCPGHSAAPNQRRAGARSGIKNELWRIGGEFT